MGDADRSIEERQAAYQAYRAFFKIGDDVELVCRQAPVMPWQDTPCRSYLGPTRAGFPLGEVMVIDINEQRQLWRRPHGDFPPKC